MKRGEVRKKAKGRVKVKGRLQLKGLCHYLEWAKSGSVDGPWKKKKKTSGANYLKYCS